MTSATETFATILAEYQMFRAANPSGAFALRISVPYRKEAHRIRMLFYRFRKADRKANESLPADDPLWGASAYDPLMVRIGEEPPGQWFVEFCSDLLVNVQFTILPTK